MAQNNLARNVEYEEYKQPTLVDDEISKKSKIKLSKRDLVLIVSGCVILVGLMIGVVSAKISVTNAQHRLQTVENQATTIKNENTDLKQQISELQGSDRLETIAKENGMSLNSSKIRNVNK